MSLLTSLAAHTVPRPYIPWIANSWYDQTSSFGGGYGTTTLAANTMYAIPIIPIAAVRGGRVSLVSIQLRISTAAAAGKKAKLAAYTISSLGAPSTLIAQSAELAIDPGAVPANVSDALFTAEVTDLSPFYLVYWGDGAPIVVSANSPGSRLGMPSGVNASQHACWTVSSTYTAGSSTFPASFPGGAAVTGGNVPVVAVKVGT